MKSDHAGNPTPRAWLPWLRWLLVSLIAAALVWTYMAFDLDQWLNLETLKQSHQSLQGWYEDTPARALVIYFLIYAIATAVSIPGATILTLGAGAIFGFGPGLLMVSFASSIGALLAFLVARYLLRDAVQRRFSGSLERINEGIERDGTFYLLTLRLVPLFPFWLVNLVMGLTPMKSGRYYVVSQLGMLPATIIYVNAGTQIAALESTQEILSPALLGSLILLGVFPVIARSLVAWARQRKLYAKWNRPPRYDRNLIVIGAGAGGLVSAYIAATVKAKVTLVESHQMGGDCLNTGCVPSKSLIRAAKIAKEIRHAESFGIHHASGTTDFKAVMERIRSVIRQIEPHDSVERYEGMGVEVLKGHARLISPWEVELTLSGHAPGLQKSAADAKKEVPSAATANRPRNAENVRRLTSRNIILATGAEPFIPDIPGLRQAGALTSESVWSLETLPARLVVLGGGPVGCELAQSFARLGSQVTLIEKHAHLLSKEDPEAAEVVRAALKEDGITILNDQTVVSVTTLPDSSCKRLILHRAGLASADRTANAGMQVECDTILCALGRRPRVEGYGLEDLGIALRPGQTIDTNMFQQTSLPNIYAVGDVSSPYKLTHAAAHQAWYASVNALFGRFKRFPNHSHAHRGVRPASAAIPRCTFTDPELAQVGLTEPEAIRHHVPYEVTRYHLDDLDRAIADGAAHGFIKILTVPGKDQILGVTIVGEHAGELLAEFVLAMRHGLGLNKILATVHTYPTWSEAGKFAAGVWKQSHAPRWLLPWVERLHTWERRE
ncbi:FAD-dependent oxidoreductase [Orrella marina]|nr:bifunctional TVP38/TMEM64 family protein/FAD-dependent oxidoreductase [Orrella marina]